MIVDNPQFGPETDALLKHLADLPGYPELDPYQALLLDREDLPDPAIAGDRDPRVSIEDLTIDLPGRTLEARIYRRQTRPRPVLLWLHGGGFVGGHLRDIEYATSRIAAEGNVTVVSLNYRLAPENPCPAALLDVYDTLAWIRANGDTGIAFSASRSGTVRDERIAIGGQSAGGALAAGACLLARDKGVPLPDRQILCYPVLDLHPSADWHEWYLGDRDVPAGAVPLQAESLKGLPPTLMLAARRDWLRDDALAYAAGLERDGVPTELVEYADTMHAFLNFPGALVGRPARNRADRRRPPRSVFLAVGEDLRLF
jgi:acetyl esterase